MLISWVQGEASLVLSTVQLQAHEEEPAMNNSVALDRPKSFCLNPPSGIHPACSQHTIEENILKKSDQKRQLDFLAIQVGCRILGG